MALTPYVPNGIQLVMTEVDNIEVSTDNTGVADVVDLTADAIQSSELTFEEVSTPNSHSPAGFPVKTNFQLIINLQTLAEAGASTFANEITQQKITFIRITKSSGQQYTFSSGDDAVAIAYFRKALVPGEEGDVWQLTGQRTLPRLDFTIS